jgi:hypothetical protein
MSTGLYDYPDALPPETKFEECDGCQEPSRELNLDGLCQYCEEQEMLNWDEAEETEECFS